MNELLTELYNQAHLVREYPADDPMRGGNPPTVYWGGEKSAEKFAELILEEVIQTLIINNHVEAANMLSEHFGDEE